MTDLAQVGDARLPARFWAKVVADTSTGCWLWMGARGGGGYGRVMRSDSQRMVAAHRFAYEALVGSIPEGLQIDHLCRVRNCVNPKHLEAVTQRINLLRGTGPSALAAQATHCPAGHPYVGANLYEGGSGGRRCRQCHRERQARRRLADLEASRAQQRLYDKAYRDRIRARKSASDPGFRSEWTV